MEQDMITLNVELPREVRDRAKAAAALKGMKFKDFIAMCLAECAERVEQERSGARPA